MLAVSQGIDVGGKTGRRGCIDTGDMMVDSDLGGRGWLATARARGCASESYLLARVSCRMLQEVDEIGRAKLAKGNKGFGSSVN